MGSDCPCAVGGAGGSGVHNQVVDDALMYAQCLQTSHPANPVRPVALSYGGDLKVATDSYPHHRKACQGRRQPLLRRTAPQEDFIEDEACPRTAYRGTGEVPDPDLQQPGVAGGLGSPEPRPRNHRQW
jgi:hypothetical protein